MPTLSVEEVVPRIDARQFCRRAGRDSSCGIRGSIEGVVVTDYDDAVGRETDIELEAVGARTETEIEGGYRVFRRQ
jgi:hypothetical protein